MQIGIVESYITCSTVYFRALVKSQSTVALVIIDFQPSSISNKLINSNFSAASILRISVVSSIGFPVLSTKSDYT